MTRLSERRLAQIQAVSGLAFATFAVLHLTNTALASFGQETYDAYQRAVRVYYQATGVELVLVVLAPAVHAGAGIARALRRRRKKKEGSAPRSAGPLRQRLHRASGYVLLVLLWGHAAATRGPGLLSDQPADFSFLTFSLAHFPWFFYPYYLLFALAGAYHLTAGVLSALPVLGVRLPQRWLAPRAARFWVPVSVAGLLLTLGLLGLGGVLFEVDTTRFAVWREIWGSYVPWMPLE